MKLLTICPSRDRPELCKRMLDSFDATKTLDSEILVYVSIDDPQIGKYEELLNGRLHIFGPRRHLVKVLNYVSTELYPDVPFYQEVNDDHIYRTIGWDEQLIDIIKRNGRGWGLACGNDLMTNEPWHIARHPSAALISGNIVRTLGCFVWPELDHLHTDKYLRDIASGIGSYYHLEKVIIEHLHWVSKKSQMDDNYRWVYSAESYAQANRIYHKWSKYQKQIDIEKIRQVRTNEY